MEFGPVGELLHRRSASALPADESALAEQFRDGRLARAGAGRRRAPMAAFPAGALPVVRLRPARHARPLSRVRRGRRGAEPSMTDDTFDRPRLVLFAGLGADERLFAPQRRLRADIEVVRWIDPLPRETFAGYG